MPILEFLSVESGVSIETLKRIVATAPRRYKVYQIPKRSGGMRTIAHPARELKLLQRIILHQVLDQIRVSDVATAYVAGRGIAFNARQHIGRSWLLKLDFKDFFHSIVPADWDRIVRRTQQLKQFSTDRETLQRLLFWGKAPKRNVPTCLSIGAPTSPALSNLACIKLDEWMVAQAAQNDLIVTRYADDITVSGQNLAKLLRFENALKIVLEKNQGINLSLNDKKRGIYGPGERRMVTGLIITPDGKVSMGRDRKREISSLVHKFSISTLSQSEVMRAKGLMAFCFSVEKPFFDSIKSKYGDDIVKRLMKSELRVDDHVIDILDL